MDLLDAVRAYRAEHGWRILGDFAGLLALENVTKDLPALQHNAEAIAAKFAARGGNMLVVEADGVAPLVLGRLDAGPDRPTLGVYVHYDGQPTGSGQWRVPPFVPTLWTDAGEQVRFPAAGEPIDDEWRLYARSASDDKAPLIALLAALDAVRAAGRTPEVNLVFCFEGEEESGSEHLRPALERHRDRLAADAWLICDGPVQVNGQPQIVLGARGFCAVEVTVHGPTAELHSGHYGNWAPNPALELARLLASLKHPDGSVAVPGFYDETRPATDADRAALAALPAVEDGLLERLGLASAEVPGSRLVDRMMIPSLNIRGLRAADVGAAARNVIPSSATASLDLRLAAGDDPDRMLRKFVDHLRAQGAHVIGHPPTDEERRTHRTLVTLTLAEVGYPAHRTPVETPIVAHLAAAATRAAGREAAVVPTLGGSVPLHHFADVLGAPVVVLPIANADNNQHAANENIRLGNLWYGVDLWSLLITTPW